MYYPLQSLMMSARKLLKKHNLTDQCEFNHIHLQKDQNNMCGYSNKNH